MCHLKAMLQSTALWAVSGDVAGLICISNCLTGETLCLESVYLNTLLRFSKSMAIATAPGGPPGPPPETLGAVEVSSCILQAASSSRALVDAARCILYTQSYVIWL